MQSEPVVEPLVVRLRPLIFVGTAAYWFLMLVVTHLPEIPQDYQSGLGDKSEHLIGYLLLSLGLGLSLSARYGPLGVRHLAIVMGIVALYGALDEITQPLFGRYCDWYDWRADLRGGLMGTAIAFGIDQVTRRFRSGWFPRNAKSNSP